MNASELLVHLLSRLDSDLSGAEVVTADEVLEWPNGILDTLVQQGVVLPEPPAAVVICDSCSDGHAEQVEAVEAAPGSERRYYIPCPVNGRVQVSAERLRRWRVDLPGLAKATARLLGTTGGAREVVRGRMWNLGWVEIDKRVYEFLLVRGLYWPDRSEALSAEHFLSKKDSPMVLSLSETPQGCSDDRPAVPLARLVSIDDGSLSLDMRYLTSVAVTRAQPYAQEKYVFRRQGEFWVTVFEGKQSILKHSQGLEYIACLLASPNKERHVLTFAIGANRAAPARAASAYQNMSEDQLAELGLSVSGLGDAGAVLDEQAKEEYRDRIRNIDEDLQEAEEYNDQGRAVQLQAEKDLLVQQLSAAVGLGGRNRKAASALDRARTAMGHSIARAIKHIGEQDKQLAQFLINSIKTGNICVYSPDKEIPWNLNSTKTLNP